MQVYLGSLYVNDFNRFGRTYQVYAQAEADARAQPDAVGRLQLRNAQGDMVPLATLVSTSPAPDRTASSTITAFHRPILAAAPRRASARGRRLQQWNGSRAPNCPRA